MSFNAREIATRDGQPLELVRFSVGIDYIFTYTNAVEQITYAGDDYLPRFFIRSAITQSNEVEQSKLTVTVDRTSPIVALFAANQIVRRIDVQLWRFHKDDAEVVSYWKGSVGAVNRSLVTADVVCESPEILLERASLRQFFQPTCRFFLADGRCPVPQSSIKVDGTISGVNTTANTITSAAFATKPDQYFKWGWVQYGNDIRLVVNHVGNTITLLSNFFSSPISQLVSAYGGCDNLPATCNTKFGTYTNNGQDFGGFYVSIENYFEKGIR